MRPGPIIFLCIIIFFVSALFLGDRVALLLFDLDEHPKNIQPPYVLNGVQETLPITLYQGSYDYFSSRSRTFYCFPTCPDEKDMELRYIDHKYQAQTLDDIVNQIQQQATGDDRARIAIDLVQRIPYDIVSFRNRTNKHRYPYELLYDNLALCNEKSRLLAYLLRELGYGVAIFLFDDIGHQAVGIACDEHDYENTGYCFIETTAPTIITYSDGDYANVGQLTQPTEILVISAGASFNATKEYKDAQRYATLNANARTNLNILPDDYHELINLTTAYGLEKEFCPEGARLCNGRCVTDCPGFSCTSDGVHC